MRKISVLTLLALVVLGTITPAAFSRTILPPFKPAVEQPSSTYDSSTIPAKPVDGKATVMNAKSSDLLASTMKRAALSQADVGRVDLPIPSISAVLGRDDPRYRIDAVPGGFHAHNPEHALSITFTSEGIGVSNDMNRWELHFRGIGYGDSYVKEKEVSTSTTANRLEYSRGQLTEWYINGPFGLEQGFDVKEPPGPRNGLPLTITLTLSGNLVGKMDQDSGLWLMRKNGEGILKYSGLTATDATGRTLRSWLELHDKTLRLRVDDAEAVYPLVIDPFVQRASLTSSDGAANDAFGCAVAIEGDTIVVGARQVNQQRGAAYVFVKPASGWVNSTETAKFTASDFSEWNDNFGAAVAISGNTIVVGAPYGHMGPDGGDPIGHAYVFVRPETGWANGTETAILYQSATSGFMADDFGHSVAISGDTIAIGAPGFSSVAFAKGLVYVFVKPSSGWTTRSETATLLASDPYENDMLGLSVATDGQTVVATGWFCERSSRAYVFERPVAGWGSTGTLDGTLQESQKLYPSDPNDRFGGRGAGDFTQYTALSGDTFVIGAPSDTVGRAGAAYVYVKQASQWTQVSRLTSSDSNREFGRGAALNGNSLLLGGSTSTYLFLKPQAGWITTTENEIWTGVGSPFAISGDTVVVGFPSATVNNKAGQGMAAIYTRAVADLAIAKTHSGNFNQGQKGAAYSIRVSNNGTLSTSGMVTVNDSVPAGVTATAVNGDGWSCTQPSGPCTRSDSLQPGATYPAITLTVDVALDAGGSVVNAATVSGAGDTNLSNNTSTDPTIIIPLPQMGPDLTVTKSHGGEFKYIPKGDYLHTGYYTLTVTNIGSASTGGTVTVTDSLPEGLSGVRMRGTGWSCDLATLTCSRSDVLAAGSSYPPITLSVLVASSAPPSVTNTATVAGGGETNTTNNTTVDITPIIQHPVDLFITFTSPWGRWSFTQGQKGATFTITVKNAGLGWTSGTVTVTDILPAGLTATAMAGDGWNCDLSTLTCTRSDRLPGGLGSRRPSSYPSIVVTFDVANDAPSSVTNTAIVSGGGDSNTTNNTYTGTFRIKPL